MVSRFIVGSEARAVQHAKLWAYHWKLNGKEALELYASSTNLTFSAFKGQLQAGWHALLPLKERATQAALQTWGELIPFLEALGASAGAVPAKRLERLVSLLGRAECPADVTFVASIPGSKGSKSAARQLAKFKPSEIHILTPTIGEWNERTLAGWSAAVGLAPNKIHLKWIPDAHPWTATGGWALSKAASENLRRSGVRLECLPKETRFTDQHRDGDPRWSHAKLYLLRSGRKRRLLVTSANWSLAAWGAGRIKPRNFELGVVFESEWTDLEALGERFDPPQNVPFCVDYAEVEERVSMLEWAEASWDGKNIVLRARSTDPVTVISANVTFTGGLEKSILLAKSEASMAWNDMQKTPLAACFMQGAEVLEVDIVDLRSPAEFAQTPLPEVDPVLERDLREAFLLQRYGGSVVDPESIPGLGGGHGPNGPPPPPFDYAVQAWIDARAAFDVIDRWRAALEEAASDTSRREQIYMDGKELQALFARRKDPGALLVAEELGWHLSEEA